MNTVFNIDHIPADKLDKRGEPSSYWLSKNHPEGLRMQWDDMLWTCMRDHVEALVREARAKGYRVSRCDWGEAGWKWSSRDDLNARDMDTYGLLLEKDLHWELQGKRGVTNLLLHPIWPKSQGKIRVVEEFEVS